MHREDNDILSKGAKSWKGMDRLLDKIYENDATKQKITVRIQKPGTAGNVMALELRHSI